MGCYVGRGRATLQELLSAATYNPNTAFCLVLAEGVAPSTRTPQQYSIAIPRIRSYAVHYYISTPALCQTASLAYWLRPRQRKIPGSNPDCDGIFPGRVIPLTSKLALQWLPCQAPGVIGSALRLAGPASVYCDWVR